MKIDLPKADVELPEISEPKGYRRFNGLLALSVVLPLLGSAIFNVIVNPYGIFEVPKRAGFNQAKPSKINNMRMFKAVEVMRSQPITVFLGSSRTEYGLDPQHPVFAEHRPAYNLAIGAATPYELRQYLEHTLANQQPLEQVVINIDEFMFNSLNVENPSFAEQRLGRRRLWVMDLINTTLTLDAFAASQRNLKVSKANPGYESYQPDGRLNLRPIDQQPDKTDYRFRNSIGFYFKAFPGKYTLSEQYLNDFKALIERCQQAGIPYKVYISPSHVTRWEALRVAGHWPMYEQMKREIVKITPVWDFSGYNSITTEPLQPGMNHYIDDSHYTKAVGDLVLNRMYNYRTATVPDDFGVLLTPEGVEAHLAQINRNREVWATENQTTVQLAKDIYQQALETMK